MAKASSARDDLLTAATELFRARGYEGVGVAELLEASGSPRGSLYFHFPGGKEQIGVEVVERAGAAVAGQFRTLADRDITLDQFIEHVFRHTAKMVKERGFDASCPIAAIAAETAGQATALRIAVNKQFDAWQAEVARAAQLRGMSEKNAADFASALITAMEGAFLVSKAQRSIAAHQNAAKAMKALGAALKPN
ncbi:MAG TPA: TetR/AcrR family transcriptional regulator [Caulobacterales bacterium]|nr:TetR/AcrR family transcriptional regulator [Caulobacterales bacterium]